MLIHYPLGTPPVPELEKRGSVAEGTGRKEEGGRRKATFLPLKKGGFRIEDVFLRLKPVGLVRW